MSELKEEKSKCNMKGRINKNQSNNEIKQTNRTKETKVKEK